MNDRSKQCNINLSSAFRIPRPDRSVREGRVLGLSALRAAVQQFGKQHGFTMVCEFREIESGRKNDRVVLREAITDAKLAKDMLLMPNSNGLPEMSRSSRN